MSVVPSPLLQLLDTSFGYGSHRVFDTLNLRLHKGCFYGLIGPNGSGKSTMLDLLMGTRTPAGGCVLLDGKNIRSYKRRHLAQKLSLVPQEFTLGFEYSVFDIVLMGRHPYIPRFTSPTAQDLEIVHAALDTMDIAHLKDRSILHLSGGEKQRVVVARSLAQDTETILLDEATSHLDIHHSIQIMRAIRNRVKSNGTTAIAAIHDLQFAAVYCDRLIVLKEGNIYAEGEVRTVLTDQLIHDVFGVTATVTSGAPPEAPQIRFEYLS